MIIKHKKSYIFLYGLLLILIAFFLSVNKKTLIVEMHNIYENYMSINPGFSSARNLRDEGGYIEYQNIFSKAQSMLFSIPKSFAYKIYNSEDHAIEHINIIIKFSNYKKILEDRSFSISRGFLDNPRSVNGIIQYQDKEYDAKIRLKGDLGDHWLGVNRSSFQVTLKGGETIFGMSKFSLHKPRARQYPYEHAFQNTLRKYKNLGAKHDFINISVNGNHWGIMNIEENISKEFLEKENLKDSLVFRFSDDKKWLNYDRQFQNPYPFFRYSDPKIIATVSNHKKYFEDSIQRSRYTYVLEERLKKDHSYLFATEPHMRALLASLLWNNIHTLANSNSRYYFNPYTLKLEPITTDQGMFSSYDQLSPIDFDSMSDVYKQVILGLKKNMEFDQYFEFINSFGDDLEEELNKFNHYFPLDKYKKNNVIKNNISIFNENKHMLEDWLLDFNTSPTSDINPRRPTKFEADSFNEHLHARHYDDGKLLIFNLLPDEVQLNKVTYNGDQINVDPIVIPGFTQDSYQPHVVETNIVGIHDNGIKVFSTYQGNARVIDAFPTLVSKGIFNPLLQETVQNFDFVNKVLDGSWKVSVGEWIVNKPIVLSGDLLISAGTKLKFSNDAYLIVMGSIKSLGHSSLPIIFESNDLNWKGIYILGSSAAHSVVQNTIFKNTSGVNHGLLSLTGGVNFYDGNITMNNVFFDSSSAEDSLNIVKANVDINNISILNSISDGFDCDYCQGKITNSSFDSIGGDGLDFSGSVTELDSLTFNNIKDKAISVGEVSNVYIKNIKMQNIGVGIASKDGSRVNGTNISISDFELHAAMSYSKKNYYDSFSSLELLNSTIQGPNPFLSQTGTRLIVNGKIIQEQDINVENLYSTGVMKK